MKFNDEFCFFGSGRRSDGCEMDRAIELIEQKRKADAPIGTYKGLPITKGKGRFGPFVKME